MTYRKMLSDPSLYTYLKHDIFPGAEGGPHRDEVEDDRHHPHHVGHMAGPPMPHHAVSKASSYVSN